ncbi:MAG: hypothetical protein PHI97_10470 [Desulfobulbus sp.]|nr:hypothetical protein [Desulfobulbus sp.]
MRTSTMKSTGRQAARKRRKPMKKIVALGLAVFLLGVGVYFTLLRGGKSNEYAHYLPQDAVATLNLLHLGQLSDSFASTALGKFLAKDTMHAVISEMGGTLQDRAEYDRMFDSVADVMTNPAFKAVFGDDAAVALLPVEGAALQVNPANALRNSLVVISRTTVAGALDLFSRMVKNANISREVVDELELTRVVIEPGQVLYGYTEGKMVFLAYNPAAIKRCLLAADKGGRQLEGAENFAGAVTYWQTVPQETTYSRLFVNPGELARLLGEAPNLEFKQAAPMLQGIVAIYSLAYAGEQGVESRARSTYRYEQLSPLVRSAVDAATHPNPTLFLLRDKSLAYSWASSLRPELISQTLAENNLAYQQADASVRDLLGVSLEDLGKAFGPQYGGVLDDIVRAALFPAPRMSFFVSVRDPGVAQKVVDALRTKIAQSGMIKEEQEQVAGHTVYCWPLLSDKDAQPALTLTDSMLYLATSKQALKEILESTAKVDSLAGPVTAQLGGPLAEQINKANTGSLVIYPQRMSAKTGEALGWLTGILATTKNISLSRFNQEMVRLMQSTEVITATSNMSHEQADWSLSLRKTQAQPNAGTAK